MLNPCWTLTLLLSKRKWLTLCARCTVQALICTKIHFLDLIGKTMIVSIMRIPHGCIFNGILAKSFECCFERSLEVCLWMTNLHSKQTSFEVRLNLSLRITAETWKPLNEWNPHHYPIARNILTEQMDVLCNRYTSLNPFALSNSKIH